MADDFVTFSGTIPYATDEQRDYLLARLNTASTEHGCAPEGVPVCETIMDDPDRREIWIASDIWADLDALLAVVADYQLRFNLRLETGWSFWTLTWAFTCSKPHVDSFGGGAAYVYKGKIATMNTWEWLLEQHNKRVAEED